MSFKAFVINLKRRPDRLEVFKKTFEPVLKELIVFSAYDYQTIKLNSDLKKRINEWNIINIPNLNKLKSIICCCLSHIGVWEKISKMNEPVFIFEDDCTFMNESAKEYFKNFVLPHNLAYDIIWFNGKNSDKPEKENSKIEKFYSIKEYRGQNSTECYLITPNFAKELVNYIKNDIGAVDAHMSQVINKLNSKSYCVFPTVCCQVDRNDTDIQKN
jgi:GR25 family glycosyltransferase involved in LPS biosynthesis